ncbi:MAG: class C sortase [Clostridia bacterium]|nr:class C sortase [Clostridia bacterium]
MEENKTKTKATKKKVKKKKQGLTSTILLVAIFFVGLSVLLYPTLSDFWNEKRQSQAIMNYDKLIEDLAPEDFSDHFKKAEEYNKKLSRMDFPFLGYKELDSLYKSTLDINGNGMMGYITIEKIKVQLPIYHGTSDEVLNTAVGHLEGSSIPIGGEGRHSVLSAHRGLPSAKLFSELDKLVIGDTFTITILDEILTYQVEKIFIVEPDQIDKLLTVEGKDYVTLMTCTPYGINTHRLLIRSKRIDTVYKTNINVTADASAVDSMLIVPFIALPLFGGLIVVWTVKGGHIGR